VIFGSRYPAMYLSVTLAVSYVAADLSSNGMRCYWNCSTL